MLAEAAGVQTPAASHFWYRLLNYVINDAGFRVQVLAAIPVAGDDEFAEERMRLEWFRFEFRVELAAKEIWVARNLYDFNVG